MISKEPKKGGPFLENLDLEGVLYGDEEEGETNV